MNIQYCFLSLQSSLKANALRSRDEIRRLTLHVTALKEALAIEKPSHPLLNCGDDLSVIVPTDDETDPIMDGHVDILRELSLADAESMGFPGATSRAAEVRSSDMEI